MTVLFSDLGLSESTLETLSSLGYETPSPIQAAAIPPLLAGRDVVGLAQTGTGKTAAFSLPLLERIDLSQRAVQLLVLAPTRELAGQVAEACERYSRGDHAIKVAALYGGQSFGEQVRLLKQGAQIVVGTPGRLLDHLDRGTLRCDNLKAVVLDEADEMLRMGFIEDVEKILSTTPAERQTALFSATMPRQVKNIADNYLRDPERLTIKSATASAETVDQRFWLVRGAAKDLALSRFLEVATDDAAMVFVRTKAGAVDVAERLEESGIAAAALTGDLPQAQREAVVARLKKGWLDVVVATDVAARGLDVDRIGLVINYDLPDEPEQYVHRIGRTGRAGRAGVSISFVHPRQSRLQYAIERHCRLRLQQIDLPSAQEINSARQQRWFNRFDLGLGLTSTKSSEEASAQSESGDEAVSDEHHEAAVLESLSTPASEAKAPAECLALVQAYAKERDLDPTVLAASLLHHLNGERDLMLDPSMDKYMNQRRDRRNRDDRRDNNRRGEGDDRGERGDRRNRDDRGERAGRPEKVQSFRFNVGAQEGVRPGHIVGAIANELGIPGAAIGPIEINDRSSIVGLPADLPPPLVARLKRLYINGCAGDAEAVEHAYGGHKRPRRDRRENRGGGFRKHGGRNGKHRQRRQ